MAAIQEFSEGLANAVKTAEKSVVRVEARHWNPASGIVWPSNLGDYAVIVTANHAVEQDEDLRVGLAGGGEVVPATLVGRDAVTDLAVLKVKSSDLQPVRLAPPESAVVGSLALALGRPGRSIQASLGIIQAAGGEWRTPAGGRIEQYLRPDLVMYPGFSGGALIDVSGNAFGMNTSGLARSTAVTLSGLTLERVVSSLLAYGHVRRGYLGIGSQPVRLPQSISQQLASQQPDLKGQETGLLISSVETGSPAERAGLMLGDTLVAIADQSLARMDDLFTFLNGEVVGKPLTAIVARGGNLQRMTVIPGER